ncbi:related to endo alpha-1,4 polygalactosaminidase precusor [Cephalotrichum gorgonifer]|uniref:alpha-galactosidase n=1 Tax=Cephalotrichum gorgonifer TaxID=2041049 RepID=A0AAE8MWD5_9PEZI|nr:related to endo alpha-1,4 polygalactosaminidase precusor [Cephalotrichum gorgonifer]
MSQHGSDIKPGEPQPRRWKRLAIILAVAITVIGLGLGLGLGIGLKSGDDDDGDDDDNNNNDSGTPGGGTNRTTKWAPQVGASWQIILRYPMELSDSSELTPDVDVYDLDLYDNPTATFSTLQKKGKRVICYFSAGSYEDYRPDSGDFPEEDLGKELDGWPGERWLNTSSPKIRDIMAKRIALANQKGCDAIDPDNVDGFQNDNGLDLTAEDSTSFVKFLSAEAAKYKLAVGLKNAGDIIPSVLPDVDFSVNEQCAQYNECDTFAAFVDDAKPVFQIEYPKGTPDKLAKSDAEKSCDGTGAGRFSTVLKKMELDGWVQYCDGKSYETAVDEEKGH